ncbi:MAG: DUF2225 domain-containing protein [Prevotella sp.]|nr:DUF2225 domain-containing protein [Alistipes senegalensis]MCM1357854.1 DUF2225 domain-containing protein [Prevotella sp.]MCM1473162.1 DUF2225 domain-containing protein [Muribaculaceae bacterium]
METEIKKVICSVCGKESSHTVIKKVQAGGVPELDLRPDGEHRNSMEYWIMECPECSYCNGSLEIPLDADHSYLESKEYTTLGGLETENVIVSRFVRKALVNLKNRDYNEAVKSYLYSAWVFDDEENTASATECRREAISIMENSNLLESDDMMLLKADLLRRTGQFDKVISEYGEKYFDNPLMLLVSQYEVKLSKDGDSSAHKMSEIPGVQFTD